MARARCLVGWVATVLLLSGCGNLGYYWQSAAGHLKVMSAARPVDDWLTDTQTPEQLKARLALSQRIRSFAVSELKLPDNASYHRYADLQRSAVVWNVVAAPGYSLELKQWCFSIVGCVTYRGYFDEGQARAEAADLAGQGLESSVYPVPAYSTLGWMNWAGGDPLLNTFIHYPEGELARLVFHELSHQVAYARDDTMFNESFATAVERLGGARWLGTHGSEAARLEYMQFNERRQRFRALARQTRKRLEQIYLQTSDGQREVQKQQALREFRESYARLRDGWGAGASRYRGYDLWVERANNASFAAQAAYDELVPAFEGLFERQGRDWQRFYDEVKRLAAMPRSERRAFLGLQTEPGRVPAADSKRAN